MQGEIVSQGQSDALSFPCSTTDRQGRATRYEYDVLNRLVKAAAADGTSTTLKHRFWFIH